MSRITKKVGIRITELRKEKGLTQEDLSGLSKLHVSYISAVECGRYSVGVDNLNKIIKAFNMSFVEFFEGC